MKMYRSSFLAVLFVGIAAIACYGQLHQTLQGGKSDAGSGDADSGDADSGVVVHAGPEGHFHGNHLHVQKISTDIRADDDDEKKDPAAHMVYVTAKGKKYHVDGCRFLKKGKTAIPLSEAVKSYKPCKVCKPPTE